MATHRGHSLYKSLCRQDTEPPDQPPRTHLLGMRTAASEGSALADRAKAASSGGFTGPLCMDMSEAWLNVLGEELM